MTARVADRSSRRWILHDYMQVKGGAERLVITIARGMQEFRLGVSGVYSDFTDSTHDDIDIHILSHQNWLPRIVRALLTFSRRVSEIECAEVVIYSGIYAPLAVSSQRKGRRIYYCHTPPRFAFDRKQVYLHKLPWVFRGAVSVAIDFYRRAYLDSIRKMDIVLTNSEHVKKRLYQQVGVEAKVLYPPVNIGEFRWQSAGDYYLSLGRLEPNKRIDRIVIAFKDMPDKKLVVASGGSQLEVLRRLVADAPNIIFTGWVNDEQLLTLIANALACIYIPMDEDFGMSAIEAMAAGKPVIGVAEGGMVEAIIDNRTGILLPPDPSPNQIADAVSKMNGDRALALREFCEQRAECFTEDRFLTQLRLFVEI